MPPVAGERQLDGFAGQRLPSPASNSRAARLTWSRRPAGLPGRPRANRPRWSRRTLFPLFYLVEIRHRQLLQIAISHPLTG
jgi:hypothetical protein